MSWIHSYSQNLMGMILNGQVQLLVSTDQHLSQLNLV